MTLDQVLDIFGFAPIGGEEGTRRVQTLNMVNAAIADAYQMTSAGQKAGNTPQDKQEPPSGGQQDASGVEDEQENMETEKTGKRVLKMPMEKEREYRALQDFTLVPREGEADAYRVRGMAVVFDTPTCLYEYKEAIDLLKNSQ